MSKFTDGISVKTNNFLAEICINKILFYTFAFTIHKNGCFVMNILNLYNTNNAKHPQVGYAQVMFCEKVFTSKLVLRVRRPIMPRA